MTLSVGIIGAGPSGIAAAIQLKRYGVEPVIFEQDEVGGLLRNAYRVENYPGFPAGIPGPELVSRLKSHLRRGRIKVKHEKVVACEWEGNGDSPPDPQEKSFLITTANSVYRFPAVVVASGTRPKGTDLIRGVPANLKTKIFFEVYPLAGEEGKEVVIVGAGDAALDYALSLSPSNRVAIVQRGQRTKALPLLQERVEQSARIRFFKSCTVKGIRGGEKKDLAVELQHPGERREVEADYVIFAVGRYPQKGFYSSRMAAMERELESRGWLYPVGDVKNGDFRQAAISVGNGIEAAMKIFQRFKEY